MLVQVFFAVAGGSRFGTGNCNVMQLMNQLMNQHEGGRPTTVLAAASGVGGRAAEKKLPRIASSRFVSSGRGGSTAQAGRASRAGAQGRCRGRAPETPGSVVMIVMEERFSAVGRSEMTS